MESSSFFFYSHMHRTMLEDSISLISIKKYGNEEPLKKKRGNPCPDTPGGFCHSGCCQLQRANGSVIHLNIHQSIEWKFPRHFFYLSGVTTSAALAKFFLFLFYCTFIGQFEHVQLHLIMHSCIQIITCVLNWQHYALMHLQSETSFEWNLYNIYIFQMSLLTHCLQSSQNVV